MKALLTTPVLGIKPNNKLLLSATYFKKFSNNLNYYQDDFRNKRCKF